MPATRRATPTSNEVARRAGVSRTTVSFVLNDVRNMGISEETRQKVLDAAKELGYEPNASARSLAGGSTGTMAVVIPRSDHLHVDAYLPRLLSVVNDRCHSYGYKVLLEATDDQVQRPGVFMNLVKSRRIDGLIVVNMRDTDRKYVEQLYNQGFPIVIPGNGSAPYYSRCTEDSDASLGHLMTKHLADLGHRRIAYIGFAAECFEAVRVRREGYFKALEEVGVAPNTDLVEYADISAQSGYEAMRRLLARKVEFTALFAGNDTVAFGAMHALREAGLRIPQDVAVVGYDDIPLAAFATPPLTTLRIDPLSQGTEAVDILVAQMNGESYSRRETAYTTTFVLRESCGSRVNTTKAASMPKT